MNCCFTYLGLHFAAKPQLSMIIVPPTIDLTRFHQRHVMPITTAHLKTSEKECRYIYIYGTMISIEDPLCCAYNQLIIMQLRWLNRVMQDHKARASDLNQKLIFLFFFAIFLIKATET